jgi:hypothetical protein
MPSNGSGSPHSTHPHSVGLWSSSRMLASDWTRLSRNIRMRGWGSRSMLSNLTRRTCTAVTGCCRVNGIDEIRRVGCIRMGCLSCRPGRIRVRRREDIRLGQETKRMMKEHDFMKCRLTSHVRERKSWTTSSHMLSMQKSDILSSSRFISAGCLASALHRDGRVRNIGDLCLGMFLMIDYRLQPL